MEARKKLKTLSVAAENTAIGEDIVDMGVSFVRLQLTLLATSIKAIGALESRPKLKDEKSEKQQKQDGIDEVASKPMTLNVAANIKIQW